MLMNCIIFYGFLFAYLTFYESFMVGRYVVLPGTQEILIVKFQGVLQYRRHSHQFVTYIIYRQFHSNSVFLALC